MSKKIWIGPENICGPHWNARMCGGLTLNNKTNELWISLQSKNSSAGPYMLYRLNLETGRLSTLDVEGIAPNSPRECQSVFFRRGSRLYAIDGEAGRPKELLLLPKNSAGVEISADGEHIACYSNSYPIDAGKSGIKKAGVRVYSDWTREARSTIEITSIRGGAWKRVYEGELTISSLSWIPNTNSIVFAVNGYRRPIGGIRVLDLNTLKVRVLVSDGGIQELRPRPSSNGKLIAFNFDPAHQFYPYFLNLAIVPVEGGEVKQLTSGKMMSSSPAWDSSGKRIYFSFSEGIYNQIASVDMEGNVSVMTRSTDWKSSELHVSFRGEVVYSSSDARGRAKIGVLKGRHQRTLLDLGPDLDEVKFGSVREICYSAPDGLKLRGLLIMPPETGSYRRCPLIVELHGGPVSGVSSFGAITGRATDWHVWARLGYALLLPDYRSSAVYGWQHIESARIKQNKHEMDFCDIRSAIQFVQNRECIDSERILLMGFSYGATLVNWILTRFHQFRAAISFNGVADQRYFYSDDGICKYLLQGPPWKSEDNYRRHSAIAHIQKIRTPCLLVVTDASLVPQYEYMYTVLSEAGIDVELVYYPGEGHSLSVPSNQLDLATRTTNWAKKHLS